MTFNMNISVKAILLCILIALIFIAVLLNFPIFSHSFWSGSVMSKPWEEYSNPNVVQCVDFPDTLTDIFIHDTELAVIEVRKDDLVELFSQSCAEYPPLEESWSLLEQTLGAIEGRTSLAEIEGYLDLHSQSTSELPRHQIRFILNNIDGKLCNLLLSGKARVYDKRHGHYVKNYIVADHRYWSSSVCAGWNKVSKFSESKVTFFTVVLMMS